MKDFIGLLEFIGWDANETMQYGFKHPNGKRQWYREPVAKALTHIDAVIQADLPGDMWYGINPVSPNGSGRAKSEEVTRVLCAYLDLDFKESGLRTEKNAVILIDKLLEVLEWDGYAMVHTGGGVQVYFPIPYDRTQDVYGSGLTVKRVELLAQIIAHTEQLGRVDNVADLTRVFRVPGSRNQKYEDKPEVFRVYEVVACEQEDKVTWLKKSDLTLQTLDPTQSET